jgi:hypothetical protein
MASPAFSVEASLEKFFFEFIDAVPAHTSVDRDASALMQLLQPILRPIWLSAFADTKVFRYSADYRTMWAQIMESSVGWSTLELEADERELLFGGPGRKPSVESLGSLITLIEKNTRSASIAQRGRETQLWLFTLMFWGVVDEYRTAGNVSFWIPDVGVSLIAVLRPLFSNARVDDDGTQTSTEAMAGSNDPKDDDLAELLRQLATIQSPEAAAARLEVADYEWGRREGGFASVLLALIKVERVNPDNTALAYSIQQYRNHLPSEVEL